MKERLRETLGAFSCSRRGYVSSGRKLTTTNQARSTTNVHRFTHIPPEAVDSVCSRGIVCGRRVDTALKREQFLSVNGNITGSFDTEADFPSIDIYYRDTDVVPDEDLLTELSAQYQHRATLL
jgi:hypothetical protein